VVIVNVTRDDLRDEFNMADEAFALSPISARAAQPREEDYDAISEAFMETSRGRWFLGEYAKRNRNADTRMVLDAVSRIEQTIAAQKQPEPAPDDGLAEALRLSEAWLAEALAAIRSAVDQAEAAASTAFDDLALEQKLAPVRKGARIIHEIAWRWREIGADSRICDLIDSQISAIETACGQISSTDPQAALSAAFDLIKDRIREFDDNDPSPPEAAEEAVASSAPASTPQSDTPAAAAKMAPVTSYTETIAEAEISATAMPEQVFATPPEIADATFEVVDVNTEDADALEADAQEADIQDADVLDADAQDEAVLDLIALEMAAPDESDFSESGERGELPDIDTAEAPVAELPPVAPEMMAPMPESIAAPAPAPMMSQPLAEPPVEPAIQPSIQPSLGSTLIARGMLVRPNITPDPLAPIRRMSQAEKIAFFS
jgi:hypothetical protein